MALSKQNPVGVNGGSGVSCGGYPCGNFNKTECEEHINANPDNYPSGSTSTSINKISANDVEAAHQASPSSGN